MFSFHANTCLVKFQDHSKVLLQGFLGKHGLYKFGPLQIAQVSSVPSINSLSCNPAAHNTDEGLYNIWHNRLGHPHHEALKTTISLCNIPVPHKPNFELCTPCCLGKIQTT